MQMVSMRAFAISHSCSGLSRSNPCRILVAVCGDKGLVLMLGVGMGIWRGSSIGTGVGEGDCDEGM